MGCRTIATRLLTGGMLTWLPVLLFAACRTRSQKSLIHRSSSKYGILRGSRTGTSYCRKPALLLVGAGYL
jgi:hypothetical protein